MHRRNFCLGLGAAFSGPIFSRPVLANTSRPLKIGLTPVFLDDQVSFLKQWQRYLEDQLQRPVAFVQRGSYREIIDLILQDQLEFAWLCGFPFVRYRTRIQLLAVVNDSDRSAVAGLQDRFDHLCLMLAGSNRQNLRLLVVIHSIQIQTQQPRLQNRQL